MKVLTKKFIGLSTLLSVALSMFNLSTVVFATGPRCPRIDCQENKVYIGEDSSQVRVNYNCGDIPGYISGTLFLGDKVKVSKIKSLANDNYEGEIELNIQVDNIFKLIEKAYLELQPKDILSVDGNTLMFGKIDENGKHTVPVAQFAILFPDNFIIDKTNIKVQSDRSEAIKDIVYEFIDNHVIMITCKLGSERDAITYNKFFEYVNHDIKQKAVNKVLVPYTFTKGKKNKPIEKVFVQGNLNVYNFGNNANFNTLQEKCDFSFIDVKLNEIALDATEPTVTQEPKPTVTQEPKPTVTQEPKPTVTQEPKPTATHEPKPIVTLEPKSTSSTELDNESFVKNKQVKQGVIEKTGELDNNSYAFFVLGLTFLVLLSLRNKSKHKN